MTDHVPLERALRDLPTGAQRPLESIEHRARAIRRRRHAAIAGVAFLTAGIVALPSVTPVGDPLTSEPPPATTVTTEEAERSDCEGQASARGEPLALDEVPDRMRLLWGEDAAPPPDEASMFDFSDSEAADRALDCLTSGRSDSSWTKTDVFTVQDGVVTRIVEIFGPSEEPPFEDSEDAQTIGSAAKPVTIIHRGSGTNVYDTRPRPPTIHAYWPATNGGYWAVMVAGTMADAELAELAESVRLSDGSIDLGGWSGADHATRVWDHNTDPLAVHDPLLTSYNVRAGQLWLTTSDHGSENVLWERAVVNDRFVDVGGAMGLLSPSERQLIWVTADGVLVVLSGADGDELLDIALTIQPVGADDQRLVEAWKGPDS